MLLNTSTDDSLCAFNDPSTYDQFFTHIHSFFDITTKTGSFLYYYNMCIFQLSLGITIDQTGHIEDKIIDTYFPLEKIEGSHPTTVYTPFRTNSTYEVDLLEQLPLDGATNDLPPQSQPVTVGRPLSGQRSVVYDPSSGADSYPPPAPASRKPT